MKTNAIARIIVWSLVLVICLGALLYGLYRPRNVTWAEMAPAETIFATVEQPEAMEQPEAVEQTEIVEPVRKLNITWPSGTVTIQPGDVRNIEVAESPVSDPKYAMVCTRDGDTLTIRYQKDTSFLSIGSSMKKDLTVTVPRDWRGEKLKLDTASAALTVRQLSIGQVELDAASGVSVFEECTVEELEVDTASGDLDFTGRLGELEVDAASANVTAKLSNVPDSIELDAASGGLDLTLPADAGFTAKISSASGRLTSEFPTTQEGKRYVCGDGACKIQASTASGSVTLRKG